MKKFLVFKGINKVKRDCRDNDDYEFNYDVTKLTDKHCNNIRIDSCGNKKIVIEIDDSWIDMDGDLSREKICSDGHYNRFKEVAELFFGNFDALEDCHTYIDKIFFDVVDENPNDKKINPFVVGFVGTGLLIGALIAYKVRG